MTPTIDQFEIMNSAERDEFFNGPSFDNIALLQSFPVRQTPEFHAIQNSERSNILNVAGDVYLIRGGNLPALHCTECAMTSKQCSWSGVTGHHEMPCTGSQYIRDLKFGYHLARLKTVTMPTNGKKGKKEYVPDTSANFDFSDQNWKSVRSMIGM